MTIKLDEEAVVRKVTTYARFEAHVKAFKAGEIAHLAILGRRGTGKSYAYESMIKPDDMLLLKGRNTGIEMFRDVRDCHCSFVVLDDIRQLLKESGTIDLLRKLRREVRRCLWSWNTNAIKDDEDREFENLSGFLLIANSIPSGKSSQAEDTLAALDRFDIIDFCPTKVEVLTRMKLFAEDPNDVDLFASLPILPNLQTLIRFQQWKKSKHLDPIEELYSECGVDEAVILISNIMLKQPKRMWLETFQHALGKSYDAAKQEWHRKHEQAIELLDARKEFKVKSRHAKISVTSLPKGNKVTKKSKHAVKKSLVP